MYSGIKCPSINRSKLILRCWTARYICHISTEVKHIISNEGCYFVFTRYCQRLSAQYLENTIWYIERVKHLNQKFLRRHKMINAAILYFKYFTIYFSFAHQIKSNKIVNHIKTVFLLWLSFKYVLFHIWIKELTKTTY